MNDQRSALRVVPVFSYPREAETGRRYVVTFDLLPSEASWGAATGEEILFHCVLNTYPLFRCEAIGDPVLVFHRYGGTYGPVQFLLTAANEERKGTLLLTLTNEWGIPLERYTSDPITLRKSTEESVEPSGMRFVTNALTPVAAKNRFQTDASPANRSPSPSRDLTSPLDPILVRSAAPRWAAASADDQPVRLVVSHAETGQDGVRVEGGASRERIPVHDPPRNLPPRLPTFAGREAELAALHARLSREAAVGITQQTAVHGHGGIGKTSLAVEYAWRYLDAYPGGAFFLSCESGIPAVAELAPHLGIAPAETADEAARWVRARLETGGPALLVLDNVPGPEVWRSPAWRALLPAGACRRLVTTRAVRLGADVEMMPLPRLSREDGVRLLAGYRGDVEASRSEVEAIVEWFDGLAVGLAVVGAYLAARPTLTWAAYARHLGEKGLGAVERTEAVVGALPDYDARVAAVFDELMDGVPPAERRALEYAAVLPEDRIYVPWLYALLRDDTKVRLPEEPDFEDPRMQQLLAELLRGQFPAEETAAVGLQGVLRLRMQARLEASGDLAARLGTVERLAEARGRASRDAVVRPELRPELAPLAALSRMLLSVGRVEAAALLANRLSGPLRDLGRFAEGRIVLENVLRVKDVVPPEHLATAYSNLAGILQDQGELGEAHRLMERAIEIGERNFAPDHPTLATSYSNLAMILQDQGELGEARRLLERAIEIDERHFAPDHPLRASRYNNLARIALAEGDRDAACSLWRRAEAILAEHVGPEHPQRRQFQRALAEHCGGA